MRLDLDLLEAFDHVDLVVCQQRFELGNEVLDNNLSLLLIDVFDIEDNDAF